MWSPRRAPSTAIAHGDDVDPIWRADRQRNLAWLQLLGDGLQFRRRVRLTRSSRCRRPSAADGACENCRATSGNGAPCCICSSRCMAPDCMSVNSCCGLRRQENFREQILRPRSVGGDAFLRGANFSSPKRARGSVHARHQALPGDAGLDFAAQGCGSTPLPRQLRGHAVNRHMVLRGDVVEAPVHLVVGDIDVEFRRFLSCRRSLMRSFSAWALARRISSGVCCMPADTSSSLARWRTSNVEMT